MGRRYIEAAGNKAVRTNRITLTESPGGMVKSAITKKRNRDNYSSSPGIERDTSGRKFR